MLGKYTIYMCSRLIFMQSQLMYNIKNKCITVFFTLNKQ